MMIAPSQRVLVIGSGGREHAICWKLSQSSYVTDIFALPGSYGIGKVAKCRNIENVDAKDYAGIATWCKAQAIDLVVVGPEDPLADGIGDVLNKEGIRCFGPDKKAAQIEADKEWAKEFMVRWDIPTARYKTFTDPKLAKEFIREAPYKALVVKATGLASGKGVVVARDIDEACKAVDTMLVDKKFGSAGETIIIEELLIGEEISLLAFTDGHAVRVMLPTQDYKRLRNADTGPNTGGMGAYCPCPLVPQAKIDIAKRDILKRAVDCLRYEGVRFVGVLYAGLIFTESGPKVLEFNCRFGDPETQVLLPLLKTDLFAIMRACTMGMLDDMEVNWQEEENAVGVVMASAGYPDTATLNCKISGLREEQEHGELVFHCAVGVNDNGEFVTNGGRVLIVVVVHGILISAATEANILCRSIKFAGGDAQFRTDIAARAYTIPADTPITPDSPTTAAAYQSFTYRQSGVDIDAGDNLVQRIKPLARGTHRDGVIGGLGGFGGMFRINQMGYKNPAICEAVNGVGSKMSLALSNMLYEQIGYDLVAMCANDVLETGAEPMAFLDYIACGKLHVPIAALIVKGIADGCREAAAALLGGETAEMPAVYSEGSYDIAGYCVGLAEVNKELPKFHHFKEGDLLIGLPSSGLHCAGFHKLLTRLEALDVDLKTKSPIDDVEMTLGQVLGTRSEIYVKRLLPLIKADRVKGLVHVTRGLLSDIDRIVPPDFETILDFTNISIPDVFPWMAAKLELSAADLLQEHNCGIGMVLVISYTDLNWMKDLSDSRLLGVLKRRNTLGQNDKVDAGNFTDVLTEAAIKFGTYSKAIATAAASGVNPMQPIQDSLKSSLHRGRRETYIAQSQKKITRVPSYFKDPVLILSTDGVGTKIKIAQEMGCNRTVGIDLVAMCVNDLLCAGGDPFTFTSYFACDQQNEELSSDVHCGIATGVSKANCSLLASHMVEVPLLYQPNTYDMAGFSLGMTDRSRILPEKHLVRRGDIVIGLPSSGMHSNGFSLVHAVMKSKGVTLADKTPYSHRTFGEELLVPTRIYADSLKPLIESNIIKAMAHITGGGLIENIPRILLAQYAVRLNAENFEIPPIFAWLAAEGNITPMEMQRTFNCGLGMVLVVDSQNAPQVLSSLEFNERATIVGKVLPRVNEREPHVKVAHFEEKLNNLKLKIRQPLKRVAVLISGTGTNLQALIDATRDPARGLYAEIVLVISNRKDVMGLSRARRVGIPTLVLSHLDFDDREKYDAELTKQLEAAKVDIVCLAGFMRMLSGEFVRTWRGRLINIHPSLLPSHQGLNAQQKALNAGDRQSGCTVHFVDEGIDTGAIILQVSVSILTNDTVPALSERIQKAEHYAFPKALRLLTTGRVRLGEDGRTEVINII